LESLLVGVRSLRKC